LSAKEDSWAVVDATIGHLDVGGDLCGDPSAILIARDFADFDS
jgi:hypothetical protein